MDDCIFCRIARNELSAHTVYEDDTVVAFLDKHPINPGHLLVIPKEHEPDFHKLSDPIYVHLMQVVKQLAETVQREMKPKKTGLVVAGLDVPHAHVHIIPMRDYHDITSRSIFEGKRANPTDDELSEIASRIRHQKH